MTYSERMDLLARSMHDLEIAANEYVQVCKSDCNENCDGCTRRVMLEVLRRRFDMAREDLDAVWKMIGKTCFREAEK